MNSLYLLVTLKGPSQPVCFAGVHPAGGHFCLYRKRRRLKVSRQNVADLVKTKRNKAILLKETTFVIWNEVKTELGLKSKNNNEFAKFLLAKCRDDDKMSDTSSESDAKRKKPAGKGERFFLY